jgi:tRNA 2-thiocytidine biosynthesis protein TtcA
MNFPIIPCSLCGTQENAQRRQVKAMLRAWEREDPRRVASIFTALGHVVPSHLLDRALFDFSALDTEAENTEAAPDEAVGAAPVHFFATPAIRT